MTSLKDSMYKYLIFDDKGVKIGHMFSDIKYDSIESINISVTRHFLNEVISIDDITLICDNFN
jgi:hypothetical protein